MPMTGLLRHANNGSEDTSADSFVPILIFVVLQANPDNMISNVEQVKSAIELQSIG
jgi:hypothetical protein